MIKFPTDTSWVTPELTDKLLLAEQSSWFEARSITVQSVFDLFKTSFDNAYAAKTNVYTKAEVDSFVSTLNSSISWKANSLDVYLKTQVYTKSEVDTSLSSKANDSAVVHKTWNESVDWLKSFLQVVYSNWSNSTNWLWLAANGSDHVYYGWYVNLTRKAYVWYPGAWNTTFQVVNEYANWDINFQTNWTGKVKVNWVEIWTWGWTWTAKICYEGFLPWVQLVGRVWLNVSWQIIATSSKFKICLSTLPTWANFIVELRKNWTAIATATIATWASATNWMYIADATTSWAIAENDKLEVYVTQVGSTVSGNDLSFQLISA